MILMKTKRLIFLLLSLILTVGVSGVAYGAAAPKKSSTSQTSSKKKNKAETKSSKSTKKSSSKSKASKKDKDEDSKSTKSAKSSRSKKKSSKASQKDNDDDKGKSVKSSRSSKKDKKSSAKESSTSKKKTAKDKSTKDKSKNNKSTKDKATKDKSTKDKSTKGSTAKDSKRQPAKPSKKNYSVDGGGSKSGSQAKQDSQPAKKAETKKAESKPAASTSNNDALTKRVNDRVVNSMSKSAGTGTARLKVNSVRSDDRHKSVSVSLNEEFTYLPVTKEMIGNIEKEVGKALPDSISSYRVNLNVGNRPLSYYINKVDRMSAPSKKPFVVAKEPYAKASKGMDGDIVAMWHSHGRYFRSGSWVWQRPFLYETAEDIYTMGYVLPYIVPMLENAGAYVMLPRERDPNKNEVIVDNDTNPGGMIFSQPYYKEETGQTRWEQGEKDGFIYDLPDFRDTENPFEGGTYRQTKTIKSGKASKAGWYADIPEDGEYAVYVSYKSLPNSTEDAHYTVNYSGGSREFYVNQTMGGGTWIYLGTFPLEAGYSDTEPVVTLDNISHKGSGKLVTADAVKIGGGMGNIARSRSRSDIYYDPSTPVNDLAQKAEQAAPASDVESEDVDGEQAPEDEPAATPVKKGAAPKFSTSGMPRFVEAARYWMQWAGIPESVYSPFHGADDYKDDYTARGHWVNYLAGGSRVLPGRNGLHIPVDISFALHTDAGLRSDNSIVGTLGIYYTNNGQKYADGTPRINSRMLTDIIMRQIVGDIRAEFEPNWTRRSMWDKSYLEARVAEVPTTLIELMSHQNFGDMRYGLDPNFQFTVGRAIYKGMLRFIAQRKGRDVVIQPLPVNDFAIRRTGKGRYRLSWKPTADPLEATATPDKYIIFERTAGNLGFRKIAEVKGTSFELKVTDTEVHSFKVLAANAGGVSFPSEVLALRESPDGSAPALIVNGFTRVSGPASFSEGSSAGFRSEDDFGVPYIRNLTFSGHQRDFRRNNGNSTGISNTNYVTEVIAGNTFDFVSEHGMSLGEAGYGFVSASLLSVESGEVDLSAYPVVDLILGKQKTTIVGGGKSGVNYRTFTAQLQSRLRSYLSDGGRLLVSGAYVASDLFDDRSTKADHRFAREVLGVELDASRRHNGRLAMRGASGRYSFCNTLNDKMYIVEKPDALSPVSGSSVIMQFGDDNSAAAVAGRRDKGRIVVMSVPFESIEGDENRDRLMKTLLENLH